MRTLDEIDDLIRRRTAAGTRPSDIANVIGKPTAFVHGRMDVMGLDYEDGGHEPKYRVHHMWDASPDELRMWLWKRQHDGAVAALRGRA